MGSYVTQWHQLALELESATKQLVLELESATKQLALELESATTSVGDFTCSLNS